MAREPAGPLATTMSTHKFRCHIMASFFGGVPNNDILDDLLCGGFSCDLASSLVLLVKQQKLPQGKSFVLQLLSTCNSLANANVGLVIAGAGGTVNATF